MATVAFVSDDNHGGTWPGIVTGDTVTQTRITRNGRYNLTFADTFAGGTVASLLLGPTTAPTKKISFVDGSGVVTEWTTTAAIGPIVIGPLAAGTYVKAYVASGAADSVSVTLAYAGE